MPITDHEPIADSETSPPIDAHGRAALLLVESLIHGFYEKAMLSTDEAVGIVERAADVQREQAMEADGAAAPMWRAHTLLSSIALSLRTDARGVNAGSISHAPAP